MAPQLPTAVARLVTATNEHDIEALVACFDADYRNETPAHPLRGFHGRRQVRHNWDQIFAAVPDVRADVRAFAVNENVVWSEWEMSGTRRDGTGHLMRGVIVFETEGDRITSARFYLEPVETTSGSVDEAVRGEVVR